MITGFKFSRSRPPESSRQGIALVVALGFVSLLMLMIVGFAISQRVERLVARAWLEGVKADQLTDAALARALASLDRHLSPAGQSGQTFPDFRNFNGGSWPFADAVGSRGSGEKVSDVLQSALTNALPQVLHDDATNALHQTEWVDLDSTNRIAWVAVNCSGFLDANVIAQTNRAAGWSPHEIRLPTMDGSFSVTVLTNTWIQAMDQREVTALSGGPAQFLLPFSYAPPEWDDIPVVLDQANDGIYRYIDRQGKEAELTLPPGEPGRWREGGLTPGWSVPVPVPNWVKAYWRGETHPLDLDAENGDLAHIFRSHWLEMLDHFKDNTEYFPGSNKQSSPRFKDPFDTLDIRSRSMCDLFGQYNVGKSALDRFEANRFAGDFYHSILTEIADYSLNPFNQPSPHVTQMWTRGTVYNDVDSDNNLIEPAVKFKIELELEFVNLYNIPVDLDVVSPIYSFRASYGTDEDTNSLHSLNFSNSRWGWTLDGLPSPNLPLHGRADPQKDPTGFLFWNATAHAQYGPNTLAEAYGSDYLQPGESFRLNFVFLLDVSAGGHNVKDIALIRNNTLQLKRPTSRRPDGSYYYANFHRIVPGVPYRDIWVNGTAKEGRYEADDPRLISGGIAPAPRAYAIFSTTPITSPWSAKTAHLPGRDGTAQLYHVQRPQPGVNVDYLVLDSVAHIGRQPLSNNADWLSIPLIGTNAVDVARYFVMKPEQYTARRGKININSPYPEVLAAGFMAANTDMTGTKEEPLAERDALKLADLILKKQPAAGYTNTVDVWRSATRQEWIDAARVQDKFQAEEIVARSMHLFTTRQQIFTILLAAQTRSPSGEVLGESRALAVVWRDPFRTDENGKLDEANGRNRVKLLAWRRLDE